MVAGLLALAGCTDTEDLPPNVDPAAVDQVKPPELGACRMLTPEDVQAPDNAVETVDCSDPHTAQTFAIGTFPDDVAGEDTEYDDPALSRFALEECGTRFQKFVGGDQSIVLRSLVSWAWFRPSEKAWDDGARWYRCDIVGGTDTATEYAPLPDDAKGLFSRGPVEEWMQCVNGKTIASAPPTPCSEPHVWRAVSTITLGDKNDPYPGDRLVEVRTRDFCSESVGAYLDYQPEYEYAYTWFYEAEWEAGNRRSICWAKTGG